MPRDLLNMNIFQISKVPPPERHGARILLGGARVRNGSSLGCFTGGPDQAKPRRASSLCPHPPSVGAAEEHGRPKKRKGASQGGAPGRRRTTAREERGGRRRRRSAGS
jgi:hypothetical protein